MGLFKPKHGKGPFALAMKAAAVSGNFRFMQNPFRKVPEVAEIRRVEGEVQGNIPSERLDYVKADNDSAPRPADSVVVRCRELFEKWRLEEAREALAQHAEKTCKTKVSRAAAACDRADRLEKWIVAPLQTGSENWADAQKRSRKRGRLTLPAFMQAQRECRAYNRCVGQESRLRRNALADLRMQEAPECAVAFRAQSPWLHNIFVPGTWIHGTTSVRDKRTFDKFRRCRGEVCASSADYAQVFFGQGVHHLGLVMKGKARALFPSDVASEQVGSCVQGAGSLREVTPGEGLYFKDARQYLYDEAWVVPAENEVVAVVADNAVMANRALYWDVPVLKPTGEPWTRQEILARSRWRSGPRKGQFWRIPFDKPRVDEDDPMGSD